MAKRVIKRAILIGALFAMGWIVVTCAIAWTKTPARFSLAMARTDYQIHSRSIPRDRLHILLAVEDPGFFEHIGVDLRTPGAGLTTITQALAKTLYFDEFRPGIAKVRQTLCAMVLDRRIDKWAQLDLFVNSAYLGTVDGREIRGFADGAETFFGRPFEELSRVEFISLVAVLPAPNALNPIAHPDANALRTRRIERMLSGQCQPSHLRDVYLADCGD